MAYLRFKKTRNSFEVQKKTQSPIGVIVRSNEYWVFIPKVGVRISRFQTYDLTVFMDKLNRGLIDCEDGDLVIADPLGVRYRMKTRLECLWDALKFIVTGISPYDRELMALKTLDYAQDGEY